MKDCLLCAGYECKKFFRAQKGWLVLGICILLHVCRFAAAKPDLLSTDAGMYYNYVQRFGGRYTQTTAVLIAAEMEKQTKIANGEGQEEAVSLGREKEFDERQVMAAAKLPVLKKIKERYDELEPLQPFLAELVYDLEFSAYSGQFQIDWFALLFVTVLSVGIFSGDWRCGMDQLLIPSKMGKRKIRRGKTLAVAVLSGIASGGFYFLQLAYLRKHWRLGNLDAPLQSFSGFERCMLPFRAREALIFSGMVKVLATMVFSLLLAAFTEFFRNEILAVIAAAAIAGSGVLIDLQSKAAVFALLTPLRGLAGLAAAKPFWIYFLPVFLVIELLAMCGIMCA